MSKNKISGLKVCLIIAIFSISSCTKFLEKHPDHSVAVPTKLSDLQALLDHSGRMNVRTTPNLGEASADTYFLTEDTYNSLDVSDQKAYIWEIGDYFLPNDWSVGYIPVYTANYCLEQIGKIQQTDFIKNQWENVYGSALFFRSYYFLNLLWNYSKAFDDAAADKDLGIVLRLTPDFNIPSIRSSVRTCYSQIIMDTKEAINYLPALPLNPLRPSKASAYSLLARAYLSMRKYDSAYKYSSLSLALKNDLLDFNFEIDVLSNIPFKAFNKEIIFYTEMNTSQWNNAPFYAKIDTVLYSQYENNDLRKKAYFKPNNEFFEPKGSYVANEYQYFSGLATDEIYLIKAECLARSNNISEATEVLNDLLIKRWETGKFIPFNFSSKEEALKIILDERRKELLFRGVRWMDIKRLNKEGANISLVRKISGKTYVLSPESPYFALPLPKDVIDQAGIEQNN